MALGRRRLPDYQDDRAAYPKADRARVSFQSKALTQVEPVALRVLQPPAHSATYFARLMIHEPDPKALVTGLVESRQKSSSTTRVTTPHVTAVVKRVFTLNALTKWLRTRSHGRYFIADLNRSVRKDSSFAARAIDSML